MRVKKSVTPRDVEHQSWATVRAPRRLERSRKVSQTPRWERHRRLTDTRHRSPKTSYLRFGPPPPQFSVRHLTPALSKGYDRRGNPRIGYAQPLLPSVRAQDGRFFVPDPTRPIPPGPHPSS